MSTSACGAKTSKARRRTRTCWPRKGSLRRKTTAAIQAGLDQIAAEIAAGTFEFSAELEDIHLNIEARLTERIGEAGKRLHTARSRNDQVATDFKLWVMRASREAGDGLRVLQKTLVRARR